MSKVKEWMDEALKIASQKDQALQFFNLLLEVYKWGYSDGFESAKSLFQSTKSEIALNKRDETMGETPSEEIKDKHGMV